MGRKMRKQSKQIIYVLKKIRKYWKMKEETMDPISGKPLDEVRDLS
jgi:hypothetical protein